MLVIIKNYNCTYTGHVVSYYTALSVAQRKEPEEKQLCINVHTINNNICDANPLDDKVIQYSQTSTALHKNEYTYTHMSHI